MEDVLTEQPHPSRFFLEDLNNFAPPSPPLPSPFLLLSNPNPNPNLIIISISSPFLSLLHHISSKTLIGTLILPEIPLSCNPLLPSPVTAPSTSSPSPATPSSLLAALQYPVSGERSHAVAETLLEEPHPERVVVFDLIQRLNFRSRLSTDEAVQARDVEAVIGRLGFEGRGLLPFWKRDRWPGRDDLGVVPGEEDQGDVALAGFG